MNIELAQVWSILWREYPRFAADPAFRWSDPGESASGLHDELEVWTKVAQPPRQIRHRLEEAPQRTMEGPHRHLQLRPSLTLTSSCPQMHRKF